MADNRFSATSDVIPSPSSNPISINFSTQISPKPSKTDLYSKFDVFLSFAEETAKRFADHLYHALNQKRIKTFKEDDKKAISLATSEAIEGSKMAVVVLSKNYASSTRCMDQLAKIVDCQKELGRPSVRPVFYHQVDPTEVSEETGVFWKAFQQVSKDKQIMEKVEQWREVLAQVSNFSGWVLQNKYESDFIQEIVKDIYEMLNPTSQDDFLVGMDSHMKKMDLLLEIGLDDVRTVGIWGMAGIGKTTIAGQVFKRHSDKFEATAFIRDIREGFERNGLSIRLQECLHQNLWGIEGDIWYDFLGINMLKNSMHSKRVLIILDDVGSSKQVEDLVGDWREQGDRLGPGSRVIVTTRDKQLLRKYGDKYIYEVHKLSNDEALQLLRHEAAVNENTMSEELKQLMSNVVEYADGHPLALKRCSSFVPSEIDDEWSVALAELKENVKEELVDTFQASFNELDDEEKKIFSEIARFYNGKDRHRVEELLEGCGFHPKISLEVLIEKSLVTMVENKLHVSNLLQEFGRHIVDEENF